MSSSPQCRVAISFETLCASIKSLCENRTYQISKPTTETSAWKFILIRSYTSHVTLASRLFVLVAHSHHNLFLIPSAPLPSSPCSPLTLTHSPVYRCIVALPQPTMTGIPSSRAMMAACDSGVPTKRLCLQPATVGQRRQRGARCRRVSLAWVFAFLHAVRSSTSTTTLLARVLRRREPLHLSTGGLLHPSYLKDRVMGCLALKSLQRRVFRGIEV